MQCLWLVRHGESTVGAEVLRQVLYQHAKSLCDCLCCHHNLHPVADDNNQDHVEDHGGQAVSLGNTAVSLEGGGNQTPALAIMVIRIQHVHRIQSALGPTPYAAIISRHRYCSRVLYASVCVSKFPTSSGVSRPMHWGVD